MAGSDRDDTATQPLRPSGSGQVFAPGAVVADRYEIVRFIAQGGMGEVYEARDRVLAERVALKAIRGELSLRPDLLARFKREIHVARKVTHPNVCRVFDLGEHGATTFLTMQFLEGESLAARVKREKRIASKDALAIAHQIAAAIDAAHAVGVIHRDLKPDNVMLVPHAVVTDFGLARARDDQAHVVSNTGEVGGTPAYMAPEQVEGATVGPAADIYAFGVLLFEMVTGQRPWKGDTTISVAVMRLRQDPPSPLVVVPDLETRWETAILAALARDPDARPPSAAAVVEILETGQRPSRHETAATPSQAATVIPSARVRRPAPIVVAGLSLIVLAIVAGGLAYAWWSSGRLPAHDRRVAIAAVNLGTPEDAWLAPAVEHMATRWLERHELRFETGVADPNVNVRLEFRRTPEGVEVRSKYAGAVAPSLAEALDIALPKLAAKLGDDQPERGPNEAEQADMKLLGATSFAAYRMRERLVDETFSSIIVDDDALARKAEDLITLDPQWAHAYAFLILELGAASQRAAHAVERARAEIHDHTRDPIGEHELDLVALKLRSDEHGAAALLAPDFARAPQDLVLGFFLMRAFAADLQYDEAISVARRLHDERPDLQFGGDLVGLLHSAGRSAEVPALVAKWLHDAPESEQALTAQIASDLDRASSDAAVHHALELLLLHGRAPTRLIAACDVFIAADRTREAGAFADEALRGTTIHRVRARQRLATIAIAEGRFSAAISALKSMREPISSTVSHEAELESDNALYLLADLVEGLGQPELAADAYATQAKIAHAIASTSSEVTADVEGELVAGRCPNLDAALARVTAGRERDDTRRALLRAAAEKHCVPCADVMRAGLAPVEPSIRSLYQFASCAEAEGNLELALDAFARTRRIVSNAITATAPTVSPYFSMLARYRHARLLERTGHGADAKAEYENFLAHWGHADREIPEVADAKKALARL